MNSPSKQNTEFAELASKLGTNSENVMANWNAILALQNLQNMNSSNTGNEQNNPLNNIDPNFVHNLRQMVEPTNVNMMAYQQQLGGEFVMGNPMPFMPAYGNPMLAFKYQTPAAFFVPSNLQSSNNMNVVNGANLSPSNMSNGIARAQNTKRPHKPRTKAPKRSAFRGVYWNKGSRSWRSLISINGKTQHLGNFNTEEEAAQEFDRKARELKRTKLNFPDNKPISKNKRAETKSESREETDNKPSNGKNAENQNDDEEDELNPKCKSKLQCPSSKYRGVYYVKQRNEWRARIWNGGKSEHLGNFTTEEEAAKEFDRRSKELGRGNLNFPEED